MNSEVIKAMNKADRKPSTIMENFKKWWKKNKYKVARVILFPLWFVLWVGDKIKSWEYSRNKWDVKRAKKFSIIISLAIANITKKMRHFIILTMAMDGTILSQKST